MFEEGTKVDCYRPKTIYEQLEYTLSIKLEPAPDEWSCRYEVDFIIPVADKAVGIQITLITYSQTSEMHKWREWMRASHQAIEFNRHFVLISNDGLKSSWRFYRA